jgi:HSP20 family protein
MDVYEIDNNYMVNAELPGVEPSNIKINLSNTEFSIEGERSFDSVCKKERYDRLELRRGRFHRTFSLPEPVDKNRIQWKVEDGVLHVVIPKSDQTESRIKRGNR